MLVRFFARASLGTTSLKLILTVQTHPHIVIGLLIVLQGCEYSSDCGV